MSQLF